MVNLFIETRTDLFPLLSEGVIGYCGMVVVFSNYLMFVGSLDFQIIDLFPVCFGLKWSRSQADWGKAWVVQARESRWRSCCHILMVIQNSASFEGERTSLSFWYVPYFYLSTFLYLGCFYLFGCYFLSLHGIVDLVNTTFFSFWLRLMHEAAYEEREVQFFSLNFLNESFNPLWRKLKFASAYHH